jgi:hypothetical protein
MILNGSTVNVRVLAGAAGAGAFTLTGAADSTITIIVPQEDLKHLVRKQDWGDIPLVLT